MEQRGGKEDVKGEGEAVQGAGRVLGTVLEVSFFGGEGLGDLGSPDGRQGGTEVLTRLRAADIN